MRACKNQSTEVIKIVIGPMLSDTKVGTRYGSQSDLSSKQSL